jgi:uncharacterized protein DUF11
MDGFGGPQGTFTCAWLRDSIVRAAALAVLGSLVLGAGQLRTQGASPSCTDFATQEDAQAFYDAHKGDVPGNPDPYDLDTDGDGKACEGLPSSSPPPDSSPSPSPNPSPSPQPQVDCADFATQEDAQAFYDAHKSDVPGNPDPYDLDTDGDGKACEALPSSSPSPAPSPDPQPGPGCEDFRTQREAQAFYVKHADDPSDPDPYDLDVDGDGEVCEGLPGGRGRPDLVVTVDDSADPVAFDVGYVYVVTIENAGSSDAQPFRVNIVLSAGLRLQRATGQGFKCVRTEQRATCSRSHLRPRRTATVNIEVIAIEGTSSAELTAVARSPRGDSDMSDNEEAEKTAVTG